MNSRVLVKFILGIVLAAMVSTAAFAQYGGGGAPASGGGGTATGGVYTPPKGGYKSSTGAAIGGGAAAGVALAYFMVRRRGSLVGCVENGGGGMSLVEGKGNKTYTIEGDNLGLKAGERVKLRGKKLKASSGDPAFEAKKLVKDYGSCDEQASMAHASSMR